MDAAGGDPQGGSGAHGGTGPQGARSAGPAAAPTPAHGVLRLGGDPPSPYEGEFGFSRVVRAGEFVLVGGTTSVSESGVVLGATPFEQAREILGKLIHELARAGAGPADVVQTRVYVTDISRAGEVGRAHAEVFAEVRPLMTMVQVDALIDPRMLVEIEAVAFTPGR